jgi:hypothetical protein
MYIGLVQGLVSMESKPSKTIDDVTLPRNKHWEFEYESPTQGHWYRKNVPAEEIAEDSEIYSAEDYEEKFSDEQLAFSMTLRYGDSGWTVSFVAPSIMRGMGDVDNRYSMNSGTLEEALSHIEEMFEEKRPKS